MKSIFVLALALFSVTVMSAQVKHKSVVKKSIAGTVKKPTAKLILIPYRNKKLWGFCDTLGNVKIKPVYNQIRNPEYFPLSIKHSYFEVRDNHGWTIIDENQTRLIPANDYDSVSIGSYDPIYLEVFKKRLMGFYRDGKEIIAPKYEKIEVTSNESFEVTLHGLKGIVNSAGKLVVPISYEYIHPSRDEADAKNRQFVWTARGAFSEQKFFDAKIPQKNGDDLKIMELGSSGEIVEEEQTPKRLTTKEITEQYHYDNVDADKFRKIAIVTKNEKKGIYSLESQSEVITPKFDDIEYAGRDSKGMVFIVKSDGKFGLINDKNTILLPAEYDRISDDRTTSQLLFEKNGKKGLYIMGTIYPPIPAKYNQFVNRTGIDVSNRWSFNLFYVKTDKGEGYVGENGIEFFKD